MRPPRNLHKQKARHSALKGTHWQAAILLSICLAQEGPRHRMTQPKCLSMRPHLYETVKIGQNFHQDHFLLETERYTACPGELSTRNH